MKVYILLILSLLLFGCQSSNIKEKKQEPKSIDKTVVKIKNPSVNIEPNQKITSPLHVEFSSDGLWFAHEGELGTATLVDADNNKLGIAILKVTDGNWMSQEPVSSKVILRFQIKNNTDAKLIFKNNNQSTTEGINKEFGIAVVLEK